jgi:hypothetical protein
MRADPPGDAAQYEFTEHEDEDNQYNRGDEQFRNIQIRALGLHPPAAHVDFGACGRYGTNDDYIAALQQADAASASFKKKYKACEAEFDTWYKQAGHEHCTWTADSISKLKKSCAQIITEDNKQFASDLLNKDDFLDSFVTDLHQRRVVDKALGKNAVMLHAEDFNAILQGFVHLDPHGT